MRRSHPFRGKGERGATQIEFVLTLFLVFLTLFFVFELCMMIYAYTTLAGAANEGLRYAITHSGDISGTQAKVVTYARLSGQNITTSDVAVTFPDGSSEPPHRVRITVSKSYATFTRFFTVAPTLRAYAEGRAVY
jgi:Flp pilus assembly protein TadG